MPLSHYWRSISQSPPLCLPCLCICVTTLFQLHYCQLLTHILPWGSKFLTCISSPFLDIINPLSNSYILRFVSEPISPCQSLQAEEFHSNHQGTPVSIWEAQPNVTVFHRLTFRPWDTVNLFWPVFCTCLSQAQGPTSPPLQYPYVNITSTGSVHWHEIILLESHHILHFFP